MGTMHSAGAPSLTRIARAAVLAAWCSAGAATTSGCAAPEGPPPPGADSYEAATFVHTVGGVTRQVSGARVRPAFFESAWTSPALGRIFVEADYAAEAGSRVIISDAFWREVFDADQSIIGSSIVLDGRPAQVVGVLAAGVPFPEGARLWVPEPSGLRYLGAEAMQLRNDNQSQPVTIIRVPGGFFGARALPLLGRTFVEADLEPGADQVAVISHRLWQSRFSGAPEVVGQRATLNGNDVTIIGVMPDGFDRTEGVDIWLPMRDGSAR